MSIFTKQVHIRIPTWLLVILGLSPFGIFVPGVLANTLLYWINAFFDTHIPLPSFISQYIDTVNDWIYVTSFFGLGLLWIGLSIFIWIAILSRLKKDNR